MRQVQPRSADGVLDPDNLVFSDIGDIANDALVRFTRPGRTGIFRQPSGGANGNTLDPRGRLVTCEAGRRRVTCTEPDGAITVLAAHHEGKRLNAPNDVVIRSDGVVYFTDPIFLGPDEGLLAPSYTGQAAGGRRRGTGRVRAGRAAC